MGALQEAVRATYERSRRTTELSALEALMGEDVLLAIKEDEESSLRHERYYDQRVYVDAAWIDKIPLASFCSSVKDIHGLEIKSKVEVGDLLVHRTRTQMNAGSAPYVLSSRSLIVQAKITDANPVVPIGSLSKRRVTSTSKELALLEHWPEFDLFETSRSLAPIMTKLKINASDPHSFYGAFLRPSQEWRFGQARFGDPCRLEFHEILDALRQGEIGDDAGGTGPWARLTRGVMQAASNRMIPGYLNSELRERIQRVQTGIAGVDLRPLVDWCFPHRMAVLMIDQVDFEGHGLEQIRAEFQER
ncbi:hypothetical protein [Pseudoxanthomonas putridarboris]|uniref:Restriction endonuclease n=1 Tax=Pseudoxanthomonas putridarboris TaxID=752605 RepID=A0ABU9J3C1_9GAMM